jgi:hypothetical protein
VFCSFLVHIKALKARHFGSSAIADASFSVFRVGNADDCVMPTFWSVISSIWQL